MVKKKNYEKKNLDDARVRGGFGIAGFRARFVFEARQLFFAAEFKSYD
jgi:hypothetical protein